MGSNIAVKGKGREMEDSIVSLANIVENAGASGKRNGEGVREVGEVKEYKIHVSSKYLALTHKKLELTRLPHELLVPKAREWDFGTPKSEIEPLIDFWSETYSWRDQENHLNSTVPQYRVAIPLPSPTQSSPLRIHFVHIQSRHKNAVPVLVIPSFPLTNLSLTPLFAPLSDPPSPTSTQPFHIVAPSIPGLGFSDPFSAPEAEGNVLEYTAGLFDALMVRLGYEFYLVSGTGSGRESAAGVDYHLPRVIGESFPERCLGVHMMEPTVQAPTIVKEPVLWAKWNIAKFFHANIFGYVKDDWKALKAQVSNMKADKSRVQDTEFGEGWPLLRVAEAHGYGAITTMGLREPNTLSYALCDSPVGLLSVVCSALRKQNPKHRLSSTEIIDLTQLAWLPGIEAGARFWSAAAKEVQDRAEKPIPKTRVALSVFGADGSGGYICPAWISRIHDVLFAQRVTGRPGLVLWERTEVVVAGIRGLAKELQADPRLRIQRLEQVIIDRRSNEDEIDRAAEDESEFELDVESPNTVVALNTT